MDASQVLRLPRKGNWNNVSVTWNLQPFHGFRARGLKHRHHRAQNPCACHAKSVISDPLQCRKAFWASKNAPRPSVFNDFDFQIALAPHRMQICEAQLPKVLRACQSLTILTSKSLSRHSAVQIFRSSTSKSAPNPQCFNDFDFQIALAPQRGVNFDDILGSRSSATPVFGKLALPAFEASRCGKTQPFAQVLPAKISPVAHLRLKTSRPSNIDAAKPGGNFQYSRKWDS